MSINKVGLISRWAHQISSAIVAGGSILASIAIRQPDNTYNVAQFAKIMSILGLIAFISGHMNIHLNLRASQIGNASYKYKLMMYLLKTPLFLALTPLISVVANNPHQIIDIRGVVSLLLILIGGYAKFYREAHAKANKVN